MKRVLSLLLCFAVLLALCSCEPKKYVKYGDNGFVDAETGIEYVMCSASLSLRPLTVEDEYCRVNKEDIFYTIQWQEPTEYLADYEVEEAAFVYRASTLPDITMENFEPVAALIYAEGNASICLEKFYCEAKYLPEDMQDDNLVDDSALVYAIRDAINGNETVSADLDAASDLDTYYIRLLSAKYPGLYYIIVFFTDSNGDSYLTDRSTGKTVPSPAALTLRMIGE